MSDLDTKRKKLELIKVSAARHELEFKIEEKMEEIDRIREHIKIQLQKEEELTQTIKDLEKNK